jgi:hypothetical protein
MLGKAQSFTSVSVNTVVITVIAEAVIKYLDRGI